MRKYSFIYLFIALITVIVGCSGEHLINPVGDSVPGDDIPTPPGQDIDLDAIAGEVENITSFSAFVKGQVTGSAPLKSIGFAWSLQSAPTTIVGTKSIDIALKDNFDSKLLDLEPDNSYYLMSYGVTTTLDTVYSDPVPFATPTLVSRGYSNSYISKYDDAVVIPVGRANESLLGEQIGVNTEFTTILVWMDNQEMIDAVFPYGQGADGSVVVLTGAQAGNAVVAAEVDGKIVWSWHIWSLEDPNSIGTLNIPSGAQMMDRNLGSISEDPGDITAVGMQYQFGRKDPFPAAGSFSDPTQERLLYVLDGGNVSIQIKNEAQTFAYSIANPLSFVFSTAGSDWCSEEKMDWWATDDGSKSIYDPSPEGWKVAELEDYADLSDIDFENVDGGISLIRDGQSDFWPYTGYRQFADGQMTSTGNYGNLWVNGAISNDAAFSPSYGLGGVAPVNGSPRGRGLALRCVRE